MYNELVCNTRTLRKSILSQSRYDMNTATLALLKLEEATKEERRRQRQVGSVDSIVTILCRRHYCWLDILLSISLKQHGH